MPQRPRFSKALLAPQYWPTWLGFGAWWLLAQLPYRFQLFMGRRLGRLMGLFAKRRVAIARRNIELCFDDWPQQKREQLLRDHIDALGISFFEIGMGWFWSKARLQGCVTYEGLHHLEEAKVDGQGVMLLGIHFMHLDLSGAFAAFAHSVNPTYRSHSNPAYDWIQRRCRERFYTDSQAIERSDVRAMVRNLKAGNVIWYAPDQDYGAKHSTFAPFFGVPAATITATAQLVRMGKARVIPFTCIRKPEGGYHYKIMPPLEGFPVGDEQQDAQRINQTVEQCVLAAPEQYLWVHRRFKTRPEGEPNLYSQVGISRGKRQ